MCFTLAQVMLPKEQALISEASKYAEVVLNKVAGDPVTVDTEVALPGSVVENKS